MCEDLHPNPRHLGAFARHSVTTGLWIVFLLLCRMDRLVRVLYLGIVLAIMRLCHAPEGL